MPFEIDASLVSRASEEAHRKGVPPKRRDRILELLDDLRDHARLANGPLPERNAYWREKAFLTQKQIREVLEPCPSPSH